MKFLSKVLQITILFSINTAYARSMGSAQKPTPQPQPTPQQFPQPSQKITPPVIQPKPQPTIIPAPLPQQKPQPIQQSAQERSYKDIVIHIKNARNVWNASRSMLSEEFVRTIVQKGRALKLSNFQIEALLQTARDIHAQFSGNKNKDIAILQSIDKQIAAAIR